MPALVAGIHVFGGAKSEKTGRDKPGHDNTSFPFCSRKQTCAMQNKRQLRAISGLKRPTNLRMIVIM
jgi:hypothetical protein